MNEPVTGQHLLGPHVVGKRVVIRRVLPGQTGPTGGPAMTDVLGICESWGDGTAVVRREDGTAVAFPIRDIVSGKPVPPRPAQHLRVSPRALHERGLALFPDLETAPLGPWLLRRSEAEPARRRANSLLAIPAESASIPIAQVTHWYSARGRRPIACVLADGAEETELLAAGWVRESDDADSLFLAGSIARALRLLGDPPSYAMELSEVGDQASVRFREDVRGRAAYSDDWLGLASLWVAPERRRRGHGLAAVSALLEWGAEQGARAAHLTVLADNEAALSLYERLGFTVHHAYRYLAAPT